MAIWQFYLEVVPSVGIRKKHTDIPLKVQVNEANEYFELDTEQYWRLASIDFESIKPDIDKIVKLPEWGIKDFSFSWKTYTDKIDNDAWMSIDNETGQISELSFRADLREHNLTFLRGMVEIAQKHDLLLVDSEGNLAQPIFDQVVVLLENSSAYKFLMDPEGFLTNLKV